MSFEKLIAWGREQDARRRNRPLRALDLFCGAGGASMGLHRAGFEVVGIDVKPQPEYPFEFHQADALAFPLGGFDFVWASPPCQMFTAYRRRPYDPREPLVNLIPQTRERLRALTVPWVIENVPGAPLVDPITLCGSMFGLDVRRHRLFETSHPIVPRECRHWIWTPRFPCATNRTNLRKTVEVGVYRIPLATQRKAMDIEWMCLQSLSLAIPPAYSEWIATELRRVSR